MNRMMRRIFLGAWIAFGVCEWSGAAERLTRLDGSALEAGVVAIDGERVVLTNAAVAAVALDDLWRIDCTPAAAAVSGLVERVILDRGEIPARLATVSNGVCRFDWMGGRDVGITQSVVRALILVGGADAAAQEAVTRALGKTTDEDQVVAVGRDNEVLTFNGSVKMVGASAIDLRYMEKDRTLSRAKVCAVVFGRTGTTDRAAAALPWKVTMTNGTRLEGDEVRLADGVLTMTIGAGTLDFPWSTVYRVEHRGRTIGFLSQMDPVKATGGDGVGLALSWQRDRNAMSQPLRLRGEIHDNGLGMHAPTELVFDLPAGGQKFLAVVGLDEEFGRKGDCVVVVQVDDREALRQRLRGTDKPLPVDIDIRNGRRLTLRVEPGENLDLGDHVNWYGARLLLGR